MGLRFDKGFETMREKTSRFRNFYFDRAVHIVSDQQPIDFVQIGDKWDTICVWLKVLESAIGHHSNTLSLVAVECKWQLSLSLSLI